MSAGMAAVFRRAYAVERDGEIVGFVRGPKRWDAYSLNGGLIAVGLGSRAAAGERVLERALDVSGPAS